MEIETAGKVLVSARIENLMDRYRVNRGEIRESEIRCVEVDDALVNLKATGLSMPKRLIRQLGLSARRQQRARTAEGSIMVQLYWPVRLTIDDRDCSMDVTETLDDGPVVIGHVVLTALDLVADLPNRRLIGNPEHGGEPIIELY